MNTPSFQTLCSALVTSVLVLLFTFGSLSLGGCGSGPETVTYSGSTTLLPPLSQAVEQFEALHPGVRVELQGGGTSKGLLDVTVGSADIAGAARELTAEEQLLVTPLALARDGLAVVVHHEVPVDGAALDDLRRLFGRGGPATLNGYRVTRVAKASAHGTAQAFAKGIGLEVERVTGDVVAGSNGEVLAIVSATTNAIGYVSHADAKAAIASGSPIRVIAVDGQLPSVDTVRDGRYPLVRTLFLAMKRPSLKMPMESVPSKTARDFVDFMRSPTGTRIILRSGFVPAED